MINEGRQPKLRSRVEIRGNEHCETLFATACSQLALFQFTTGSLQFAGYQLFVWQNGLVLGGENLVGQIVDGVMCFGCAFLGAEDQADGRVLAGLVQCSRA